MGTHLAPGMRKLPSQLELQMLTDLRNTSASNGAISLMLLGFALLHPTYGDSIALRRMWANLMRELSILDVLIELGD
jgi:hypothetical protein